MIHMEYYLVVSTIMMFAGIYGFFTRRNTLAILISVELMLNATDINFAVFNRFLFPGEWRVISLHSFPSPSRLRKLQ
jgi:NADH-quinone oxidoreductase subunit K